MTRLLLCLALALLTAATSTARPQYQQPPTDTPFGDLLEWPWCKEFFPPNEDQAHKEVTYFWVLEGGQYCAYKRVDFYYWVKYAVKGTQGGKVMVAHHWFSRTTPTGWCQAYNNAELPFPVRPTGPFPKYPVNHNGGGVFGPPSQPPAPLTLSDVWSYNCHAHTLGMGPASTPPPAAPAPLPPIPQPTPGSGEVISGPSGGAIIPNPGQIFEGPGFCRRREAPRFFLPPTDVVDVDPECVVFVIKCYFVQNGAVDWDKGKIVHSFKKTDLPGPLKVESKNGFHPLKPCTTLVDVEDVYEITCAQDESFYTLITYVYELKKED